MVTDAQVRRLREKRMLGKTLAASAAAAGMSERTARRWQSGGLPSAGQATRWWRTREDPFAGVWASEIVPQLAADTDGRLQVLTLFRWLCQRHPGRFQPGQLRTLQRRVRAWRAAHGADREVYFEQVAVPGREAAFDFTDASDLGVAIRGARFPHLLFEWVLSYSKWTLSTVIQLSPTRGHLIIPNPLVNPSTTSMPVDACRQGVCGRVFRNLADVRAAVAEFVERYNRCWRLEKLAYRTPLEAREEYELRQAA